MNAYDTMIQGTLPSWDDVDTNPILNAMLILSYMDAFGFTLANAHNYLSDEQMLRFLEIIDQRNKNPMKPLNQDYTGAVDGGLNAASGVSINAAGTGYVINDVLTFTSGSGTGASVTVTNVGGSGEVTGFSINTSGEGYAATDVGVTTSGGTGAGATFDIGSVSGLASLIASIPDDRQKLQMYGVGSSQNVPYNKTPYAGTDTTMTANLDLIDKESELILDVMISIMLINGVSVFDDQPLFNIDRVTSRLMPEKIEWLRQAFNYDQHVFVDQTVLFVFLVDTLSDIRQQYEGNAPNNNTATSLY